MAEVKWIKITVDMFNDEKIKLIEYMPEGPRILLIWIKLLTLAGRCNDAGYIYMNENIPYTEDMLSKIFNVDITIVRIALKTFAEFKMIELTENNSIKIVNWEKHQNIDGLEKIREQTRNRVANHRKKQKLLTDGNVTNNDTVTQGNGTDIDIDIDIDRDREVDKEKDINNIIILTSDENEFIKVLEHIPNYPLDREKDVEYYHTLEHRYPQLDLVQAINDWAIYKQDKPLKPKDNPRSQINTSFKKYVEWSRCLKGSEKYGKPVEKPGCQDDGIGLSL